MPAQLARTHLRTALLKPTTINSILAEVRALQAQGRQISSLMRGEPDFATPAHIVEAAIQSLRAGRTGYADNRGEPKLREAVANKLYRDNELSYDPASEILVTDGATLGIHAALMTLAGPGDDVLLPDPIYDAYQSPIKLAGASARPVRSRCERGRFALTVEDLEDAWAPNCRVLLLNTPWNPVGTVLTRSEIEAIGEFVCRRNLTLISDEIYEFLTYQDHRHISPAAVASELRERCVIVNSLSKTYAMPGWRLGYCAAPTDILRAMLLILQQSSRGPATFVQDAGVVALAGPQECVQQMRASYAERRQAVVEALTGLPAVDVYPPDGGFFAIIDVHRSGRSSDEVRRKLLQESGVAVVHGRAYGEGGEGMLRVSFATGGPALAEGLQLLRNGLAAL